MNPDNPYAAPQTIGLPPLVMATSVEAEPLMFLERSTERLQELLDYSYAIQQMHVMWILLAVLATCIDVLVLLFSVRDANGGMAIVVSLGISTVIYIRVAAGYSRQKLARGFAMLSDGLLLTGCLWSISIFLKDGALIVPIVSGFIALHAAASFLAHYHARELFGQQAIKQDDLAGEITYRQLHGIG